MSRLARLGSTPTWSSEMLSRCRCLAAYILSHTHSRVYSRPSPSYIPRLSICTYPANFAMNSWTFMTPIWNVSLKKKKISVVSKTWKIVTNHICEAKKNFPRALQSASLRYLSVERFSHLQLASVSLRTQRLTSWHNPMISYDFLGRFVCTKATWQA